MLCCRMPDETSSKSLNVPQNYVAKAFSVIKIVVMIMTGKYILLTKICQLDTLPNGEF